MGYDYKKSLACRTLKRFGMYLTNSQRIRATLGARCSRFLTAALIACTIFFTVTASMVAGEPDAKEPVPAPPLEAPPQSLIHGLINLELSNAYITPRGLDVQNKGLVIQPLLLLFFDLYSSKQGPINDVTLTLGDWNSVHTATAGSGPNPGHWNESDPLSGLTVKFLNDLQFDAFYTAFVSEVDAFKTSQNLDLKFTYHDKFFSNRWAKGFSLNPYVEFFLETSEKATVVLDPSTSRRGFYFQLGADPTYAFGNIPLTLEFPTYVNFPNKDFYQNFAGNGSVSTLGLVTTELKGTVPLRFIPKGYGSWSIYAGVQYYYLINHGLLDENQVLATSERKRSLWQVHGGLTIFF
jgi:hypothetical protein